MEEEDDPPVDDDFEVDLEAVDVVSVALAVVSLGFNADVLDSILVATAPVNAWALVRPFYLPRSTGDICRVPDVIL